MAAQLQMPPALPESSKQSCVDNLMRVLGLAQVRWKLLWSALWSTADASRVATQQPPMVERLVSILAGKATAHLTVPPVLNLPSVRVCVYHSLRWSFSLQSRDTRVGDRISVACLVWRAP
jgi:site-specific recombinase